MFSGTVAVSTVIAHGITRYGKIFLSMVPQGCVTFDCIVKTGEFWEVTAGINLSLEGKTKKLNQRKVNPLSKFYFLNL
jgi:hypothetical protein